MHAGHHKTSNIAPQFDLGGIRDEAVMLTPTKETNHTYRRIAPAFYRCRFWIVFRLR